MAWVEMNTDMTSVQTLPFAERIAVEMVDEAGIEAHDPPTVRRLDLATDVLFHDVLGARRVLDALSALTPARYKLTVVYARGSALIESVYWSTDRGIRLRVYNKSGESKQAGTGTLVRFEHQDRPRSRDQRTVDQILVADLSQKATKPLGVGQSGTLLVADLAGMHAHVAYLRDQNRLSQTRAERLIGSLVWARIGGPESWTTARTARLRRRELEDLGIAFHPQLVTSCDLGPLLSAITQAWR